MCSMSLSIPILTLPLCTKTFFCIQKYLVPNKRDEVCSRYHPNSIKTASKISYFMTLINVHIIRLSHNGENPSKLTALSALLLGDDFQIYLVRWLSAKCQLSLEQKYYLLFLFIEFLEFICY